MFSEFFCLQFVPSRTSFVHIRPQAAFFMLYLHQKEGDTVKKITDTVSVTLEKNGIIGKEETAICSYGLELLLLAGVEFASVLLLAAFVGNFFHTILFLLSILPLRMYAGGYHADTRLRCYLILLLVYGLFSVLLHYTPNGLYPAAAGISVVLTVASVWALAPIVHKNKRVTEKERAAYRKISLVIMSAEVALLLFGALWKPESKSVFTLSLGQFAVAISMLAAFVKNKKERG